VDRIPVVSSSVASVGYEETTSLLEVEFTNGSVYRYFEVPSKHFESLTGGQVSVGRYLNAEVKPHHRYEQVIG
jgi:hypothetical protein